MPRRHTPTVAEDLVSISQSVIDCVKLFLVVTFIGATFVIAIIGSLA